MVSLKSEAVGRGSGGAFPRSLAEVIDSQKHDCYAVMVLDIDEHERTGLG